MSQNNTRNFVYTNLIKQQIQLFCYSVSVVYLSFYISYKFRQDYQFVQHTHTHQAHSFSQHFYKLDWTDIIFRIRSQCLKMQVLNVRWQHGTATKVSATHKWCRSVQVSCWAVHMWMWENCNANSLTQNESAVVQCTNNRGRKRPTQQPSTIFRDLTTVWATNFLIGWSPTK